MLKFSFLIGRLAVDFLLICNELIALNLHWHHTLTERKRLENSEHANHSCFKPSQKTFKFLNCNKYIWLHQLSASCTVIFQIYIIVRYVISITITIITIIFLSVAIIIATIVITYFFIILFLLCYYFIFEVKDSYH